MVWFYISDAQLYRRTSRLSCLLLQSTCDMLFGVMYKIQLHKDLLLKREFSVSVFGKLQSSRVT